MTKWILPLVLVLCGSVQAQAVDPTGFTEQLNVVRHSLSLPLVSFGPDTVGVSQANNAQQRWRGLGHWVTGNLYQCACVGTGDTAGTLSAWLNSPSHAAIILSPALTAVGYANDGYAASVACSMGQPSPSVPLLAGKVSDRWGSAVSTSYPPPSHFPPRRGLFRRFR